MWRKVGSMMFDSHTHTRFSVDSEMEARAALTAAAEQGLGLVFTEHLDVDFPGDADFVFDAQKYFADYAPLAGAKLRLGVEVGMREETLAASRAFVASAPFDLVIGSIHLIDGKDIYYKESFAGQDKAEMYGKYFALMAENLRTHDFIDVLGHIDYIARYAPYGNPELSYGDFADEIDAVLRACVETGTVMELNTRRLRGRRAQKELMPIYARYDELGGRYVTLGSDAHTADAIGANFAAAEDMAAALGLRIVTFAGRKMEFCEP